MSENKISLEALLEQIPDEFRQIARDYAPKLFALGREGLSAWVTLVVSGDYRAAFATLLAGMETPEAIREGGKIADRIEDANRREAAHRELYKNFCLGVLQAILAMAAASVAL